MNKRIGYALVIAGVLCGFLFVSCGGGSIIDQVKNGRMEFDTSTTVGKVLSRYSYIKSGDWSSSTDYQGGLFVSFTAEVKNPKGIIAYTPIAGIDMGKVIDERFTALIGIYCFWGTTDAELAEYGMDRTLLEQVYYGYYEVYKDDNASHDEPFFVPTSGTLEMQWIIEDDSFYLADQQMLKMSCRLPYMDNITLDIPIFIESRQLLQMVYENKSYLEVNP
jgi:hypothetical protein